ncbi:hypothetical protein [Flavobacterium sp. J27]|uniref:hypothetical protein n=1 Tax=Flavobacterium sp. J27 TaxID=2060419 RepID=UPI0010317BB3|nr:hypothetical protein [Flavobacterium sp. J27]
MKQDTFIEKILNSTLGITKAIPNEKLFQEIQAKIEENKPIDNYTKWLVAASVAILLTINVFFLNKKTEHKPVSVSPLFEITTNNQLY